MAADNPHFEFPEDWSRARELVDFDPVQPGRGGGFEPTSLAVFVRDHRLREIARAERSLEAHYGDFVFTQSRPGRDQARRLALETSYGVQPRTGRVGACEARVYEAGPVVEPDDIDGRSPAVIAWCDGERFYLLASSTLSADDLLEIAGSIS